MTYKREDWLKMCTGLDEARQILADVRAGADRDRLDAAIIALWRFAEYAINVVLEMAGLKPELHHQQATRARDLKALGLLQADYHERLDQLNQYRLRAFYAGYSSARSVHYSPRNVEDCLDTLTALRQEVGALLQARGKLP
jgi:hypothetical protein